jgi:hypothetical protein
MLLKSVSFKPSNAETRGTRPGWQAIAVDDYHNIMSETGISVTNKCHMRFEINFDAATCVTGFSHKGDLVKYCLFSTDGLVVKHKAINSNYDDYYDRPRAVDFAKISKLQFTKAFVVFNNTNRPMQLRFETLLCTVQLSGLGDVCDRFLEQDLNLVCSDGSTAINSVLASATSGMIKAKLGNKFASDESVDLSQYKLADVEIVKRIMLTRTVSKQDLSPSVVELLHYLQVEEKDKIWVLVRTTINVANCVAYMCLADRLDDAPTRAAAETFFKTNATKFVINDPAALMAAVGELKCAR